MIMMPSSSKDAASGTVFLWQPWFYLRLVAYISSLPVCASQDMEVPSSVES